jgi:hypothetical protein
MVELNLLGTSLAEAVNMDEETFNLSIPYWKLKAYKKGKFYNEYH